MLDALKKADYTGCIGRGNVLRKGEERKQEILTIAEKLFCVRGYQATSVQDILDELKASKGAFYHHFESKGSVLETLCTQRAEKAAERTREKLAKMEAPMDRLNAALRGMSPLCREEAAFLGMLLPQLFTHEGCTVRYAYQEALREAFLPIVMQEVDNATAAKVVAPAGGENVSDILLTLMNRCWLSVAEALLEQLNNAGSLSAGAMLDMLNTYRAVFERLLDAPFGSVDLAGLDEWNEVVQSIERRVVLPAKG